MSLKDAFNATLNLVSRDATISRPGVLLAVSIRMANSNYSRQFAAMEGTEIEGYEFVIPKSSLDEVSYPSPRRGDLLVDTVLGRMTITESKELFGLKGEILGYRVRTA